MENNEIGKNEIVDKVLTLQIHKVPILTLSSILSMSTAEIDKIMREHGYALIDGLYKKNTPIEPTKTTKIIKKRTKVKKKSQEQLRQEEIQANPTRRLMHKYGEYNFETNLFHVNVEVLKVLLMQDEEKLPIEKIAERMKMTVKVLTNFMKKHNYELKEEETPARKTKKAKPPKKIFVKMPKVKKEEDENDEGDDFVKEIPLAEPTNEVAVGEIGASYDDIIGAKKAYNWYLAVKDLPIF